MKINPIQDILSSIGISFPGNDLMQKYSNEKPPLRSELFSADQMEQYGKTLAFKHKLIKGRAPNILLKRLAENEDLLLEVHHLLTEAVKTNRRIIPAGEWLLDNFYLIQEQIRTGKKHLPKGYSEDLPRLLNGSSAGLPRVYDIAIEIISHSDGRVDLKNLSSFITAYQAITPLKLGELWAIPIMLRLALIENLRRLSAQIAFDRINQNLANYWVEQMNSVVEKDPKSLILIIADMARSNPPMVSSFVAELSRQLQGKGPALALPLNWIEQRLSETGQTGNELINTEIQKQAADQVSMSNSIGSLRFLGTMDWRDFVESISIVEQILKNDISGIYGRMDFSTRDHYRHVVEKMSKQSEVSEQEIAQKAIHLAEAAATITSSDYRSSHVGYYLVGKGVEQVEKEIKIKIPFREKVQKTVRRFPLLVYAGAIFIITLIIGGSLSLRAYDDGINYQLLIFISIFSLLSASHFAVTFTNWLTTLLIQPKLLPRMDFTHGIDPEFRSIVIIPAMLTNDKEIDELAENLEVYFLANRDKHLHFGLLTDFTDAAAETVPEDDALLQLAKQKIEDLNNKYESPDNTLFYLFHRPRKCNAHDRMWMGYERKRGKLTELNALLRGEGNQYFSMVVGKQEVFPDIKYVITIDADTQLPRDSGRRIIATMAHPLNRAFYNEKKQRVTEGYGILQPRVALSLPGSNNSLYARMHGNDLGIDPYTRTSSDVYQDLFGEGSFIGKGIYEIDIFRKGLDNRFPENRILSHDLLEGCYLRSGLLSDVQLYEEYPARYSADVKRRHRWIRGDWQIASWFLPFVPAPGKGLHKNPLSSLSRWKIFDNVRRSLVPTGLLLLLLFGWTIMRDAWFWTLAITSILLLPSLIGAAYDILHKPKEILLKQHFKDSINAIINNLLQTVYTITCLPFEAFYSLDAIIRTNWRMIFSHKHLLEWNPYVSQKNQREEDLLSSFRSMWTAPFAGFAGLLFLSFYAPLGHIVADPILILWMLSPAIAWFISRPLVKPLSNLTEQQTIFLRKIARKTWAYFEKFVTADDNWLPPDNFQEHPVERIAHRTSPTNIGLSLLSNLAAVDFGYITYNQFLDRTSNSFATLQNMETYRGHFYNWYDTLTTDPLPPRYISTVDSGNLAGMLLTLRQGIIAIPDQPIIGSQLFDGLYDTLLILKDEQKKTEDIQSFQKNLDAIRNLHPITLSALKPLVEKLVETAERIAADSTEINLANRDIWANSLLSQCKNVVREISILMPWALLPPVPPRFAAIPGLDTIPTLAELSMLEGKLSTQLNDLVEGELTVAEKQWVDIFSDQIEESGKLAKSRIASIDNLGMICQDLSNMEYDFLYDRSQHLLTYWLQCR